MTWWQDFWRLTTAPPPEQAQNVRTLAHMEEVLVAYREVTQRLRQRVQETAGTPQDDEQEP